ncbi:MAG: bifunctional DNA primase/polymerase [Planctomycetia bacterium]|nr:bifunctional DNA primase/polymerase [Planctomycetia bacterium]
MASSVPSERPEAQEQQTVEPQTAEPQTVEPQTAEPQTAEPQFDWFGNPINDAGDPHAGANGDDLRAWARRYRARGLALAEIEAGDKRPAYPEWNLRSKEPDDFDASSNIGILTGTLSGDLVCVDLDAPEAVARADEFLPATELIEGRPGKPRSHRYYRVTNIPEELTAAGSASGERLGGPKTRRYARAAGGADDQQQKVCLVEVLGTGRHATAPPSWHASGERRAWDQFGEPATVDCQTLYAAVEQLAEACGWRPSKSVGLPLGPRRRRTPGPVERRYFPNLPPLEVRARRAAAYLAKVPEAVSGEGGHDRTFHVACLLVRDFALDLDTARAVFEDFNVRCDPPWSEAELEHKLEDADQFEEPRGGKLQVSAGNAAQLAERFLDGYPNEDGLPAWRYWRDQWWRYDACRYQPIDHQELRAVLTRHLQTELRQAAAAAPTTRLVNDVELNLKALTLVSSAVEQPCWLHANGAGSAWPLLALRNGLVDVDGYLRCGHASPIPHSPRWFSPVCLPYDWDASAGCQRWLDALDLIFAGDAQRVALLQEWFGYCLLPRTDLQKFLVLAGEGGNGKSVLCAALTAVLGDANVSNVPLEDFGQRFALTQTVGKLANIAAEVGDLDKTAEGKLKSFTGGDRMTFDRKNRAPIEAVPTARLVLATNNVPRFADRSAGVWRRLLLVPCDVTIPSQQRVLGMDQAGWWVASDELPGMLRWALEGLRRLRFQGRFTEPAACRAALDQHRTDSNPARAFLLEHCALAGGGAVACQELYQNYRAWCGGNGYQYPLASNQFGKEVIRVFPTVRRQYRGQRHARHYEYDGLRQVKTVDGGTQFAGRYRA